MKKSLLVIATLLMPLFALAQRFEMVPGSFVNAEDTTKHFLVIDQAGSREELFQKAKTALTMIFNSPKDVLSFNQPDVIIANGFSSDAIVMKKMGMTFYYGFSYRLQFTFRDGRFRIDAPQVDFAEYFNPSATKVTSTIYFTSGSGSAMYGTVYVWDKKGKLKQEKVKQQVEHYFNSLFSSIIAKMSNGASEDDW